MGCGASAASSGQLGSEQPELERETSDCVALQPSVQRQESDANGSQTSGVPPENAKVVQPEKGPNLKKPSMKDFPTGCTVYYRGHFVSKAGSITLNTRGKVLGPNNNMTLEAPHLRKNCTFEGYPGSINCYIGRLSLEKLVPLEGYPIATKIFSWIDDKSNRIKVNDAGTIVGPCGDSTVEAPESCVSILFPGREQGVLMRTWSFSTRRATMPSGFKRDQVVYYNTIFEGQLGSIKYCEKGVVNGVCNNAFLDRTADRVNCSFPNHENINIFVPRLSFSPPKLPSGFEFGQTVYYLFEFSNGEGLHIKPNDKGVIKGACNNSQLDRCDDRVLVEFADGQQLNTLADNLTKEKPAGLAAADAMLTYMYVKDITGKTMTFEVALSFTVRDLKGLIEKKESVPAAKQRLVFEGKELEDKQELGESGLSKGSTLFFLPCDDSS